MTTREFKKIKRALEEAIAMQQSSRITDTDRLNWIESGGQLIDATRSPESNLREYVAYKIGKLRHRAPTAREAIDAAIKIERSVLEPHDVP